MRIRPKQTPHCSRRIPKYRRAEASRHVPDQDGSAPLAHWKRVNFVRDSFPDRDGHEAKVAAGDA